MYFAIGERPFIGDWMAADGCTMRFGSLPHTTTPMTMAEARSIPPEQWLRTLREAFADDVPAKALIDDTKPHQLFVAGAGNILPPVAHWHRNRMVLVGDATHAPSSS